MASGHQSRLASASSACSVVTDAHAERSRFERVIAHVDPRSAAILGLASRRRRRSRSGGVGFTVSDQSFERGLGQVGRCPLVLDRRTVGVDLAGALVGVHPSSRRSGRRRRRRRGRRGIPGEQPGAGAPRRGRRRGCGPSRGARRGPPPPAGREVPAPAARPGTGRRRPARGRCWPRRRSDRRVATVDGRERRRSRRHPGGGAWQCGIAGHGARRCRRRASRSPRRLCPAAISRYVVSLPPVTVIDAARRRRARGGAGTGRPCARSRPP